MLISFLFTYKNILILKIIEVNFFHQIHRSIIDPSFYSQVIALPIKRVLYFLLKLITITALILAITHSWRVVNKNKGLPLILSELFPDMIITNNGMYSNRETPYIANPFYVADFMVTLVDIPKSSLEIPDSFIVVDDRKNISIDKKSSVAFLLAADIIHVNLGSFISYKIPYSSFVYENEQITFTKEGVYKYLKRRLLKLIINFFTLHCFSFGINITVSVFFLFLAACIFKIRQVKGFKAFFKIASFAVTPIAIKNILVAIAGVKIIWTWHVSIFISTFILYRALNYLYRKDNKITWGV